MSHDQPLIPRPPSAFHNEAYHRDAGHDALQQEVLRFLRGRSLAGLPPAAALHREVEGERPLYRCGQIVGYVDACEIVTVNLFVTCQLFEIKPRIQTVFGIVRQAKATLALAKTCIPADLHFCHVVVPHNDPKLSDLRAEWPHVWAWGVESPEWDGVRL